MFYFRFDFIKSNFLITHLFIFVKSSIFFPNVYFKIITSDLWLCIKYVYLQIKQEKCDINQSLSSAVAFLALIYGKLSFFGYSGIWIQKFF